MLRRIAIPHPLPVTSLSVDIMKIINKGLVHFPEKAYLVHFSSPFLGVHSQVGELLRVAHSPQEVIPDLGVELFLDCLQ